MIKRRKEMPVKGKDEGLKRRTQVKRKEEEVKKSRDGRVFGEKMEKPLSLLSSLSFSFSSSEHLKREGNRIIHHGADSFDSCVFDFPMAEVCFSSLSPSVLSSLLFSGFIQSLCLFPIYRATTECSNSFFSFFLFLSLSSSLPCMQHIQNY